MSPDAVSGAPKCFKICFWWGLCPGPCWESLHHSFRPPQAHQDGESGEISLSLATFGGLAIPEKIKQIVSLFY